MTRLRKTLLAFVIAVAVLAVPSYAFFGIVHDPLNEVHHIASLMEHIKQVEQLVTTYNRITQQYNHMVQQAKYITNMGRYRGVLTPWKGMSATNTYGNTGGWIGAVNSGLDTVAGWQAATVRISDYGAAIGNVPLSQIGRRKGEYGTLELQDGAAVSAMDTMGRIRLNGPRLETTLATLEADALSTDAALQTEAAQMNKANAIALIQAKLASDQNKLLVTNAEIGLLRMKQERDAAANAIATEIAFRRNARAAMESTGNAGAAMRSFRLP